MTPSLYTTAEVQAAFEALGCGFPDDLKTEASDPPSVGKPAHVEPVSGVLFRPDDLYQGDAFYTFMPNARRTPIAGTWDGLARWLSCSTEGDPTLVHDVAKRARGAWVPGRYSGTVGRKALPREFLGTQLLVADVDAGDPYAVADALCDYRAIIHSTYKHTPTSPRCRVVLLLASERTSARHYDVAEHALAGYLNSKGFRCPAGDSTLGKLAFLPMHQRGVSPIFLTTSGRPADISRWVAADERRQRLSIPTRTTSRGTDHSGAVRWAADHVATAREGERHNTRRDKARWLSELGVDDEAIRAACLDAGSDAKAVATVEWAIATGREAQP